jgi:hypothetical protein
LPVRLRADRGGDEDVPVADDDQTFRAGCGCLPALVGLFVAALAAGLLVVASKSPAEYWRPVSIEAGLGVLLFVAVRPILERGSFRRALVLAVAGAGLLAGGAILKHGYWAEALGTLAVECLLLAGLDVVVHRVRRQVGGWEEDYFARAFRFPTIFDQGPFDQDSRPAVELTLELPVIAGHGWDIRAHRGEHGTRIMLSRDVDEIDVFLLPDQSRAFISGRRGESTRGDTWCRNLLGPVAFAELEDALLSLGWQRR